MVCIHAVHPQSSDNWGLSELQVLAESTSPAPLHPCVAPKKGRAQHPVSGPSPPLGLTLNHDDFILHPHQQNWGKVTCESPLRVRGRNRRYLCSYVIGAPAKCCTSGTAVNKAGEAGEPQWTAARGSGDLQPRSRQWGEGMEKAELPRGVGMPKHAHLHLLILTAPWYAGASFVPGEQRQELATDTGPAAPVPRDPVHQASCERRQCSWAVIPTWKSHPQGSMGSTKPVSRSLQALLKSDMT